MFTLMTSLATVMALGNADIDWNRALKWAVGISLAIALPLAFLMKREADPEKDLNAEYGLIAYKDRFWIYVAIVALSLMMVSLIIRFIQSNDRKTVYALSMVGIIGVYFCTLFIFNGQGKTLSYDSRDYVIPKALSRGENIHLDGLHDAQYRVDFYKDMDNMGMFWDTSCIQAFHSIVPSSVIDFYTSVGVQRGVGSRPEVEYYAIRSLLSVKYLFDNAEKGNFSKDQSGQPSDKNPQMPGWSLLKNEAGYNIWQNDCYIPMGFTYDYYITEQDFTDSFAKNERGNVMLRAIVLSDSQEAEYGSILQPLPSDRTSFNESSYKTDCRDRADMCCHSFVAGDNRFTAAIMQDKPNLVFFSIPYHDGWKAYVNGKETKVEKVNMGFMAVECGAGFSEIEFEFETPMLKLGTASSVCCLFAFAVYVLGSVFLLLSVIGVVAVYIFGRRHSHWLAGFAFMECIFMLTCRQHERYQIVVLALLMGAFIQLADRRLLTLYGLNSLVIFFNQFRVLSSVREKSGWWRTYKFAGGSYPQWLNSRSKLAFANSLLNLLLFAAAAEDWTRRPYTCLVDLKDDGAAVKLPPLFGMNEDYTEHQRDPKIIYNEQSGKYYIILGAQTKQKKGCCLIYVDLRKLMQLMGMGIKCGDTVEIKVEGSDEAEAAAYIENFLKENF